MVESPAFYIELGSRIREEREKCGLTQEALASLISLTRTSVTNIEKGRQKLLVHTLVEIATALKVTPELLLPKSKFFSETELDEMLKERSAQEQYWIRAVVDAAAEE